MQVVEVEVIKVVPLDSLEDLVVAEKEKTQLTIQDQSHNKTKTETLPLEVEVVDLA